MELAKLEKGVELLAELNKLKEIVQNIKNLPFCQIHFYNASNSDSIYIGTENKKLVPELHKSIKNSVVKHYEEKISSIQYEIEIL